MDILILLGGFTVLCALGVPVAYALGSARCSALCGPNAGTRPNMQPRRHSAREEQARHR